MMTSITEQNSLVSEQITERCASMMDGLACELPAAHEGVHAADITRDEDGNVDGAVTWKDTVPALSQDVEIEEKVKALVVTDDPRALRIAKMVVQLDDESLQDMTGTAEAIVQKRQAEVAEELADHKLMSQIGRAAMLARILERGARMLPSESYKCEILRAKKPPTKRFDVLKQLFGKVPVDRLKNALWQTVAIDTKKAEPAVVDQITSLAGQPGVMVGFDGDATKLKKLRDDFGGEIAKIINAGLDYQEGPPVLVFEPLPSAEKNVTPAEGAR